jgi:hypothetical protein
MWDEEMKEGRKKGKKEEKSIWAIRSLRALFP